MNSSRVVGRILKICKETYLRLKKDYFNKIKQKNYKNERIEIIEIYKLDTSVYKKNEFS